MNSFTTNRELTPGKDFRDLLVSRSHIEKKKGNGPEVKLTLTFNNHRHSAKKWNLTETERDILCSSQFLIISGSVENGGGYHGEITITNFRQALIDELPSDISPYLCPRHDDFDKHLLRFEQLVALVQEPNLRGLLAKIFDKDKDIWPVFCEAHAAGKKHHAYPGGLLHHSVEVAELCVAASQIIPSLSRDLLITCALLHDLGKLNEMEHGLNAGEYTVAGILNGHISLGSSRVRQVMNNTKGFPPLLKESVMHMILSHHGALEYGSPKLPMFAEAQTLAQCDLLSARVYEYTEAAKNANGQLSVWLSGKDNIQIYTGDLGLQTVEEPISIPFIEPVPKFTTEAASYVQETTAFYKTRLPIRGFVAAGSPEQSSEEEGETREAMPPPCGADYLLRVTGDSMIGAGICHSDLLFVKSQETAKDGEIVIANVSNHGEVVKRLRRDPAANGGAGQVWLDSENPSPEYQPILVVEDTRIQGRVVGLLRDF